MIIVLERGASEDEMEEVLASLSEMGLRASLLRSLEKPVIHLVTPPTRAVRKLLRLDRVEALVPTPGPRVRREGRRFYPYHFINWVSVGLLFLGVLVALAGFFPTGVGREVDPHGAAPEVTFPWYLDAPGAFLRLFPDDRLWLGWLVLGVITAIVFFLPWIDRAAGGSRVRRQVMLLIGALVFVGWLWLLLSRMF